MDDQKPVMLIPLQELKKKRTENGAQNLDDIASKAEKRNDGIRHSFYPTWTLGLDRAREFAHSLGFVEVQPTASDFYTTVSVFWRQREMVIKCDRDGMMMQIRHRSTRWLSATFHKAATHGFGDVRCYLECRAVLDDDESCVQTIVDYMNGRSIYTESFVQQIREFYNGCQEVDDWKFSPRPLIPEIFQLNWKFRGMRLLAPLLKFVNDDGDVIILHNVNDGIFHYQKSEFDWFDSHFEYEIGVCMDHLNHGSGVELGDEVLCKKSYDYSLKLFDFVKNSEGATKDD